MSLNNRPRDGNDNNRNIQSSKSKSNNDDNITSRKYVIQRSGERTNLSQVKDGEHPIITAKRKIMNLTSVGESQRPQVYQTKALHELAVKTNKKIVRRHESIAYRGSTRGYIPRISRPEIPDTWGQEPTGPLKHEKTVARSTSRDHPYTPSKKQNVAQSKKNLRKVIKTENNMKPTSGDKSTHLNAKVRIRPEEEFNNLNDEIANKTHQDDTTASSARENIFIRDKEKPTPEMVSLYPDKDSLIQESEYEIERSVSRDLSDDKLALSVHTYPHGNVSQRNFNTSNDSFSLHVSNEPSLAENTKLIRSLQHVPAHTEQFEPKPGSSKAPDLNVLQKLQSSDSIHNPIDMTELTNPSEIPDVGYSGSNAIREDTITYKLANVPLQSSDGTSSGNSRVVPFTYARLEKQEEKLRELSDQFTSSQNDDKVILDNASSSPGQLSMASESRQDIAEELPRSIASSFSIERSLTEPLKISPIGSDLSSIAASANSFKDKSSPSFFSTSPTPMPQTITCSSRIESPKIVQVSKMDPTEAANQTVEAQTQSIAISVSKSRQGIVHFESRQQTSSVSGLLNLAITSTPILALKLNSLNINNIYISREEISQPLIPSNEQSEKQFSLSNFLHTVIGQVTGIFGLKLLSVIRNFSRLNSEMANGEATLKGYDTLIVYSDIILLINPLIEDLLSPVIQITQNDRSIISSLIDTRCEIILPNPTYSDDCQIRCEQCSEQRVPVFETIWTETTQLFVPRYKVSENLVFHVLQIVVFLSSVLTIQQVLNISGVSSNELLPSATKFKEMPKSWVLQMDDILIGAKLDILEIISPLKFPLGLLDPINALINVDELQWKLERCGPGTLLVYDAINPMLILLLGRGLGQFSTL